MSGMFEKKPNSYNLGSQNTVDGWQVCIVLNSFQKFNDCEPYSIWILFVKSNCLRVGMSLNVRAYLKWCVHMWLCTSDVLYTTIQKFVAR